VDVFTNLLKDVGFPIFCVLAMGVFIKNITSFIMKELINHLKDISTKLSDIKHTLNDMDEQQKFSFRFIKKEHEYLINDKVYNIKHKEEEEKKIEIKD